MFERFLGELLIGDREERGRCFEHHHLRTEPTPHTAELETDHTGADDANPLRDRVELERPPTVDDVLAIEGRGTQRRRDRAARQHHMSAREPAFAAIVGRERDLTPRQQLPAALQRRDAGRLEQLRDAAGHAFDDPGLALLHGRDIHRHLAGMDAVRGELGSCPMEKFGRFEQGLGGDATRVEAGATEGGAAVVVLPSIDAGDLEPVLAGADRGRIARRTAADDDDVVAVVHDAPPQMPINMRPGSSSASLMATRNCTASRPSMMRWS